MSRKTSYDTSHDRRELPLTLDEVQALLAGGGSGLKTDAAVNHLLQRVVATMREQHATLSRLQADVDRIRIERADRRLPFVRAMEALDQMSDDEQRRLLDVRFLAEVEKLRALREQTELEQAAARNEVNRARLVLAEVLLDELLDPVTRQRIQAAERRLGGV